MISTLRGFVFLWALIYSFMGFMFRRIDPANLKNGGRIAFFLTINAITAFILLVAFVLTKKVNIVLLGDLLRHLLSSSWGF